MKLLESILKRMEAAFRVVAAELARMAPTPAKVPVPVRNPHLSYSLSRRKRLEWVNFVCRRER